MDVAKMFRVKLWRSQDLATGAKAADNFKGTFFGPMRNSFDLMCLQRHETSNSPSSLNNYLAGCCPSFALIPDAASYTKASNTYSFDEDHNDCVGASKSR